MPTYEFRCPKGHEFERFYKTMSTAPSEAKCPECGAVAVRQLSGGGGLVFKGSGFYLTDYGKNAHRGIAPETKSEGGKAEGGKAEGGKAEGGKTEGGKAESPTSKPQTKPDAPKPKAESTRPPEGGTRARSDSAKSSKKPKPKSE
jgi:putative FmdB family regulatory protein